MKRICTLLCVLLFVASFIPAYGQENLDNSTLKTPKAEQKYQNTTVENIKNFTELIEDHTDFDWKACCAWLAALFSAVFAGFTLWAQYETKKNTKKLPQSAQRELLIDLARHLYRNFVVTRAMRIRTLQPPKISFPSEMHFQKLKVPLESIHLDTYYEKDFHYQTLHRLYLEFRNYNLEIDVAMKHITNSKIDTDTKKDDFDTLENRIFFLTGRIADVMTEIWGKNKDKDGKAKKDENKTIIIDKKIQNDIQEGIIVSLGNEQPPEDIDQVNEIPEEFLLSETDFDKTQYARIFTSNDEISNFIKGFNNDVQKRAWKICMIQF